ncbi:rabenosyn-5-like isoform X4 [Dreissena polymorpha]|uniref:rabenosyn-5-like isoform X4 n=1 Tax=Dreissena polymorpha TaxID=45954 RepID=UPI0022655F9E|nr:rabenosyn-5-like isoform X4 [Dreissena polymorpha]
MAASGGEILEGFLCPMCMKDLGTPSQLQSHFEEAHSTEDKATLNQLRGLFDKAKKKFLGDKEVEVAVESGHLGSNSVLTKSTNLYNVDYWQPQDIGAIRSQTDYFRSVRDTRVDKYVVQTNKLLIRLDKLIAADAPTDSGKRKAFEKSVVHWQPDNEVNICRFCNRSFSMTRRRHHCRLCGGIMCDRCSQFLTHAYAKKLTNPAFSFDSGREQGFLKRSSSNSSLNSMFSSEGDPHIRSCDDCRKLLERRDLQMEQRNTKSTIVLLYEKLKFLIEECEALLAKYLPMVESLSSGESTYKLQEAQLKRTELVQKYHHIDEISKRISTLNNNLEERVSHKQDQLQKSIRTNASNVMQENMMGPQNLPSEEHSGESTYRLQEAQLKRTELVQKYDHIDEISKRISTLNNDLEESVSHKQDQLQKSIRTNASNFMQENMMGLQNLPSEEHAGEFTYRLQEAQVKFKELVKKYGHIEKISNRIDTLNNDSEESVSHKQDQLQKSIQTYASNFILENMMGLQDLPSEEQYAILPKRNTKEVQRRIENERLAVLQAREQEKRNQEKISMTGKDPESSGERSGAKTHVRNSSYGWKPSEHSVRESIEDPMLQQMDIIRGYIEEAKMAQKWDEKLKFLIEECEALLAKYLPMVESLSVGESTYRLQEAQVKRTELVQKYDHIDKISKRISTLNNDSEESVSHKQDQLQKSIRTYASNFIQENMMGLQNLPSEEQYAILQKRKASQVQERITKEREAVLQAQEQEKRNQDKISTPGKDPESSGERSGANTHIRNSSYGWKPSEHSVRESMEDPMLQQMDIIRGYIKEAKMAQKWDEVKLLEQNLLDLKREFSSQQKQTWS